jgi:hypothetical protein
VAERFGLSPEISKAAKSDLTAPSYFRQSDKDKLAPIEDVTFDDGKHFQ